MRFDEYVAPPPAGSRRRSLSRGWFSRRWPARRAPGRRERGARVADAEEQEPAGEHEQHGADSGSAPRERVEVRDLRAGADADVDAGRAVGVHDHDRPRAVGDVPAEALRSRAGGGRRPDALLARRRGAGQSGRVAVVGVERRVVDVGQGAVRGAAQVLGDVAAARDADEHGLVVAGGDVQAQLAVAVRADDVAGAVEVDVEVAGGDRGRVRRVAIRAGGDVALVVLLAVRPEQAGAGGEEAQREQRGEPTRHDRGDAPCGGALGGRLVGRFGHRDSGFVRSGGDWYV